MLYYSHSKKIYGTRREKKEIKLISKHFPKTPVYNPNNTTIKTAVSPIDTCLRWIESDDITRIVFSTYRNHVGKGVYTEVKRAEELGKPTYVIVRNKISSFIDQHLSIVDEHDWIVRYAEIMEGGD